MENVGMFAISNVTCAVVSAKWAMDLGYSQVRQVIFALGGFLL